MASEAEIQELWRLFRENRDQIAALNEHLARNLEADERRGAESEARMKALDKQIAETNKQIGNLTGKWGRFVEEMVRPAAETIFQDRGIEVHEVHPRMRARRNGESMEIDVFVGNDSEGVAIEVKTTLGEGDVRKVLERLPRFKTFFPRFADIRLYGAVAGIDIPNHVRDFAINQGLFVLGQSGETVAIRNAKAFNPRAW